MALGFGMIELGIICIATEINMICREYVAKGNNMVPRTENLGTPKVTGKVKEVNNFD